MKAILITNYDYLRFTNDLNDELQHLTPTDIHEIKFQVTSKSYSALIILKEA